ncbi:MAG: TlpA family protein disulfide reductase [Acetobacteraceae bacterium]|nr:TlpA family protein disulfide reductase [Acetobacteraceae bacterium]
MNTTTRRALLTAGGIVAAGTLAAVALLRKPGGPAIQTLVPGAMPGPPAVKVGTIANLRRTEPPAVPAAAVFRDGEGGERSLAEHLGHGLVVNLWATWCAPCVAEMPELQALARAVAGDGILVLPLSSDRGGAEVVRRFYAANGIDALPVLLDPRGEAARAWGARGLPTTLVIDRQGRERGRVEGAIDWASAATVAELRQMVE